VLIVDDDAAVCWALRQVLTQDGFSVAVAADAATARRLARRHRPSLVITDLRMPGGDGLDLLSSLRRDLPEVPVVLTTAYGTLDIAVPAGDRGAFGYLPKPLDLERTLDLARRACGRQQVVIQVAPGDEHPALVGSSPAMQEVYRRIAAAAASDVPVLIHGPSGTGKELVAHNIHRFSRRADAPFVAVNCGAIPPALVESELFGHVAGAFTGASQPRVGRCQSAAGGVLFLDEIGDLPAAAQASMLRFLDQHVVTPVGSTQEVPVNVRVIAASNRPLSGAGAVLRSDLFYRLRGVTIATPAIMERPEDLPGLVAALLARIARRLARTISVTEAALTAIRAQSWPGNVRELKHRLEEAAVLAPGGVIAPEHLTLPDTGERADFAASIAKMARDLMISASGDVYERCLSRCRDPLLRQVLAHTYDNYLRSGELLGINRVTLKRWVDEGGICVTKDEVNPGR
ncbi:MAG TPA: sigma 54-interacting transcriptional regulator, partial [Planctomycetota bacterium]|nr:sigma 54-interacting transcriptional regulator [Planctomycetota bacterium]